jgi:hypothetical protein
MGPEIGIVSHPKWAKPSVLTTVGVVIGAIIEDPTLSDSTHTKQENRPPRHLNRISE